MQLDFYFISVIVFFIILGLALYRDRKNLEVKYILIIRRSKKGLEIFDKIAKNSKFWKILGNIGILASLYLMIFGLVNLIAISKAIIEGKITGPTGGIVLPSPTSYTIFGPGYIAIPFWIWITIVPIVIIPHEIFHGIMCRIERVKVKSFGFLLFGIFPGAFVEPDDNQIKKLKFFGKLRIFTAGSFVNFLVAMVLFVPFLNVGLIQNFIWPAFVEKGIYITEINKTSPAYLSGIPSNSTLTHINGKEVEITYSDFLVGNYIHKYLDKSNLTKELVLTVNGQNYTVRPDEIKLGNITRPYLGIKSKLVVKTDEKFFFEFFIPLLTWMWIINLAVAIVNILPIYPLDGGHVFKMFAEKITKKYQKELVWSASLLTITLLIFTIIGPYIIKF